MRKEDKEEHEAFSKELIEETDRGAALVGAAMIDYYLKEILQSFMVSNNAAGKLLDGPTAPLGTLSSRIDACYALGLVSAHERSEFHLIRAVRNEFAHRTHGTTFKDVKISELCRKLESDIPGSRESYAGRYRSMFINTTMILCLGLIGRRDHATENRRHKPKWSKPLVLSGYDAKDYKKVDH